MKNSRYLAAGFTTLAIAGLALGATGIASAGTLPTTGNTIAMTVANDTNQTIYLQGSDNPYGNWIAGPPQSVSPHSSRIITATNNDPRGLGVDVTYSLPDGTGTAVFMANDYPNSTDIDGTRTTGPDAGRFSISSWIDTTYPDMNVTYHLSSS